MNVLLPETLDDATALLADTAAVPVAGGTDLLVHWPESTARQSTTYVDLSGIAELRGHVWSEHELRLGALSTYWDILEDERAARELPLLGHAAATVGAVQIQTRGTWAGNIVNASPAADGVPALLAYDAEIDLVSSRGRRSVRLDAFYSGYKQMERRPDELIVAIRIPRRRYRFQCFEKVGSRRAQAITKVGVALAHSDAGWRIAANSVAPTVVRCRALEAALDAHTPFGAPEALRPLLDRDVAPIDDIRSTAEYRGDVLARVLFFALRAASSSP